MIKGLCELCSPKQWKTLSSEMLLENGYPVYGANGIIGYYSSYNHEKETLLITCRGATCGTLNISLPYSYINGNAMALDDLSGEIDIHYLYYYLQYRGFSDVITGSAQPQIVRESLKKVMIDFPNLDKQASITYILSKNEQLISLRKKQLQKLDDLVKARFVEMFGEPHRSKRYSYSKVSELTDVISGGTPDRKNGEYWNDGTIPWVKTTELQNGIITEVEERITEKGLSESSAKIVPASTVLIAMYGQGKTRGMTGFLGIKACTNQACACLLPTSNIDMKFLWYFLILSYDELRGLAQGGNQPNLNAGMIKDFPILVPPKEEQRQFVSFVTQSDQSKLSIRHSLEKLETLKQSLMQQYFG